MKRIQVCTLTNMCMIYSGTKILVENRLNKDWPGVTFPGGHVEKSEPFSDAVIREVYEETGLIIKNPRLCGVKDWIEPDGSRYISLLYKTNQFEGELKSSDEGEVFWIDINELSQFKLANDMDELLKIFLSDDLNEFFYHIVNGKWKFDLK